MLTFRRAVPPPPHLAPRPIDFSARPADSGPPHGCPASRPGRTQAFAGPAAGNATARTSVYDQAAWPVGGMARWRPGQMNRRSVVIGLRSLFSMLGRRTSVHTTAPRNHRTLIEAPESRNCDVWTGQRR